MPYKDPEKRRLANLETTRTWRKRHPERVKQKRADSFRKYKYGITADEYSRKLIAQGGVCAICGTTNKNGYALHVDHNHITGELRDLLCHNCNNVIVQAHEEIPRLLAVIEYLKKWNRSGR